MTAYAASIARQMIAHALADEERREAQRRDTERGGRRAEDTCDRCSDTGKVYLASFVTPLNLAPWDEGPQVGECPDCCPSPKVGSASAAGDPSHGVVGDVDQRPS
jgi:hypothetical protein